MPEGQGYGESLRILITGITGFVGSRLSARLAGAGHELAGLAFGEPADIAAWSLRNGQSVLLSDLATDGELTERIADFAPERVVHLAAQSSPGLSLRDPEETFRINVTGTLRLLEGLRSAAPEALLLFVSSSEVYGLAGEDPIVETAPVQPCNPYGSSKAAGELLVRQYARTWGLGAVIVRSFPHAGPGQRPIFALPAFARQIARIEAGLQEPVLRVGNLEARRDFLDVDDVAEAYTLLLAKGEPGETYNLCSGEGRSIRAGLDGLLALAATEVELITDPDLLRPLDMPVLVGNGEKLRETTGWRPRYSFAEMLERILADWRRRVSEEETK